MTVQHFARPVVAADSQGTSCASLSGQSRSANKQDLNKGESPKLQSRGKSKRVKTLLAVLNRRGVRGEGRNRNLPSPRRVFGYFLHEQKVTRPAGIPANRIMRANIGWRKADATTDQSKTRKHPEWRFATGRCGHRPLRGSGDRGASRRVDVVIDPYGALRIVALRDWPLRSAATTT